MIRMRATMVTATATTTGVTTELEPVLDERPDLDEFLLSALGTTVLSWVTTKMKITTWLLWPVVIWITTRGRPCKGILWWFHCLYFVPRVEKASCHLRIDFSHLKSLWNLVMGENFSSFVYYAEWDIDLKLKTENFWAAERLMRRQYIPCKIWSFKTCVTQKVLNTD